MLVYAAPESNVPLTGRPSTLTGSWISFRSKSRFAGLFVSWRRPSSSIPDAGGRSRRR
jgi:hypothetical protein